MNDNFELYLDGIKADTVKRGMDAWSFWALDGKGEYHRVDAGFSTQIEAEMSEEYKQMDYYELYEYIEKLRAKLDDAVEGIEKALVHIPEFSPAYNHLQEALARLEQK